MSGDIAEGDKWQSSPQAIESHEGVSELVAVLSAMASKLLLMAGHSSDFICLARLSVSAENLAAKSSLEKMESMKDASSFPPFESTSSWRGKGKYYAN